MTAQSKQMVLLSAIMALAVMVRLINLNSRPLWYDEAFSVLFAEKSITQMVEGTIGSAEAAAEEHPLLYYFVLHAWLEVMGESPVAVRMFSVLLGSATVGMVYFLARRLFDWQTGAAAAFITAVEPFHVYYSQEVRMYALLGLVTVMMTYFFVRAWMEGGKGNWVTFAFLGAIALYTHNLATMFIAGLNLWVLWFWWQGSRWQHFRSWLFSHLLMLLLFAPWLVIIPRQLGKIEHGYWITKPGLIELLQTLFIFHFAYDNQTLPSWLLPLALLFSLLIPFLLVRVIAHQPRKSPATAFPTPYTFLLFLSLAPILLTFMISQILPIYTVRSLLPSALVYYILVAYVLLRSPLSAPLKWGTLLPALLIVIASLINHYNYASFPRPPFYKLAADLRIKSEVGTAFIHSNKFTFLPTHYYDRSLSQSFIADSPGSPADTLSLATQQALGLFASPDLATAAEGYAQIYFVIFRVEVQKYEESNQIHPHLAWLNEHYTLVNIQSEKDLMVYEYVRKP